MQLVEQHVINKSDTRYAAIDQAAFASKNLYNAGNYEVRQAYISEERYLNYHEMDRRMQPHEAENNGNPWFCQDSLKLRNYCQEKGTML